MDRSLSEPVHVAQRVPWNDVGRRPSLPLLSPVDEDATTDLRCGAQGRCQVAEPIECVLGNCGPGLALDTAQILTAVHQEIDFPAARLTDMVETRGETLGKTNSPSIPVVASSAVGPPSSSVKKPRSTNGRSRPRSPTGIRASIPGTSMKPLSLSTVSSLIGPGSRTAAEAPSRSAQPTEPFSDGFSVGRPFSRSSRTRSSPISNEPMP